MKELQQRLLEYEQTPPLHTWAEIADALDTGNEFSAMSGIGSFEEIPDNQNWEKIEKHLFNKKDRSSFFVRYRKSFIYSGTAAAIILCSLFISLFLISKNGNTESPPVPLYKNNLAIDQNKTFPNVSGKVSMAYPPIRKLYNQKISGLKKSIENDLLYVKPLFLKMNRSPLPIQPKMNIIQDVNKLNEFLICTDKEGHAFRLSKKLWDHYYCKENNEACRSNMLDMEKKVMTTSVSGDFLGLLEQINILNENQ